MPNLLVRKVWIGSYTHRQYDAFNFTISGTVAAAPVIAIMDNGDQRFSLYREDMDPATVKCIEDSGYRIAECLIDALPRPGYDARAYHVEPARPTRVVEEGDEVSIGNRRFAVMELPGHSPGSIGLWEAATGTLFSGDAAYDGPLLDMLPESDIAAYCRTMERLLDLPVSVVHAGHDPSFGRDKLVAMCRDYLDRHAA